MSDALRARLLAAYADEHRDHLAALRAVLASGGGDLEEAYRHAHSLKGAARAVDLPAVVDLAHQLESLLEVWWEGGVVPDSAALDRARAAVDAIEDLSAAAIAGGVPAGDPEESAEPIAATVRVEAETVDRLVVATARLLAELERRRGSGARGWDEDEWVLERTAEAVAEDVARLRLITAEATLGNFGPMLRTLAAEMGKTVRYDVHGLATQADREVLTTVAEAVMHLLRNAIAHGIETPAQRLAAGKDPTGHLTLSVASSGPRLEIRVGDDGAGIAVARLAQEAVARGLLGPDQAARADDDQMRQLAFHPGLSTADHLSTTAGRGMGMAIVRRLVDRLQGQVELRGRPGGGTEVVIRVPVSIMVQRVVLVQAGGRLFGLPASAVVRLLHVPASAVVMLEGRAVVTVDNAELPLADLAGLLGLPAGGGRDADLCVALVRTAGEVVALSVDNVADTRDQWVSPLEPSLVDDPRLAGTVTLAGGVLALVLSPGGLRGALTATTISLPKPPRAPPLVLVVDDSPTIRALERAILEAHSYRVEVAVDGRDALDRMARRRPDLVVSDIEMPRLDGLGLLAAMRADPALAEVPVVLVSSRTSPESRNAGMALGAGGYLLKTRFDQREFLDTIERLTA
ncbi:MAG: response regulator [Bacteroidota bacterium]